MTFELDRDEKKILVSLLENAVFYYPEDLDYCKNCEKRAKALLKRLESEIRKHNH